jgi:hypothetical protein
MRTPLLRLWRRSYLKTPSILETVLKVIQPG